MTYEILFIENINESGAFTEDIWMYIAGFDGLLTELAGTARLVTLKPSNHTDLSKSTTSI